MPEQHRCLVIGGSGALGQSVCRALVGTGSRVAFTYCSNESSAQQLATSLADCQPVRLDLRCLSEIDRAIDEAAERLGGLDAFVQCAAVGVSPGDPIPTEHHQRMDDIQEAGWDAMMAVNVKGTFFACRRAARHMVKAGGGNIVLLGSIDGIRAVPSPVHYSASKGALVGMMLSMSKELGSNGIRVNLVAPGVLEQGISRTIPKRLLAEYLKHCGLKRVGRLPEIASLVAWLARENTYITGQTITADGAL